LLMQNWCLNGRTSLIGLQAKEMSTRKIDSIRTLYQPRQGFANEGLTYFWVDWSIDILKRVFLSRNYLIFNITPPEGGWEMCPLCKRRLFLYWVHVTPGVLPKKVKTFAHRSNINFSRADQHIYCNWCGFAVRKWYIYQLLWGWN